MEEHFLENNPQVQNCFLLLPQPLDEDQLQLNEEMRNLLSSAHYSIIKEYELNTNNQKYGQGQ